MNILLWVIPSIILTMLHYTNTMIWLLCCTTVVTQPIYNSSPYVSPLTMFLNYEKMVQNFKVFMYNPQLKFTATVESLFYSSLQNSTYLTKDPEEAHLFFLPVSPGISTRSLARVIARTRNYLPYWNRTLGADHFYLSCDGIPLEPDRNLVELKKNAVQVSCFPTRKDRFVPHKDVTLPLLHAPPRRVDETWRGNEFCVMEYGNDVSWIGEALRLGCVPVVVVTESEGHINDMPFMDVLRWSEMAVFVRSVRPPSPVLDGDKWKERRERMRGLGVGASKHWQWNQPPLPFDAFKTIMYQLWLRRHTVRYVPKE